MQCLSYKLYHTSSALAERDTFKGQADLRSELQKSLSSTMECRSSPARLLSLCRGLSCVAEMARVTEAMWRKILIAARKNYAWSKV